MSDAVELLRQLVAIDTTSRRSNLELIEFVEEQLDRRGVTSTRVPNEEGHKANLFAHLGPDVEGGVVLSGHTDCVPVDEQPWASDPFELREEGGRLYGRGAADMKGFLAVVLSKLDAFSEAELTRPVFLALSYDEELGTLGAPSLVDAFVAQVPRPSAVIIGEPTSLDIVDAHKGVRAFTTRVEGLDAHSSQPQGGANAVSAAARIAAFIDDLAQEVASTDTDPRFEPPYTTFNVATIHGGQAINIIPRHAELTWEYRPVPADDSDELADRVRSYAEQAVLPLLRSTHPAARIDFDRDAVVPTLGAEEGGEAVRLVRSLTGMTGPTRTVAFGTDGGHFQQAGLSTVVFGPGSIDQAHQPDEYIELAQLDRFGGFLDGLIDELA
ncbi:MAG: acetylornithine deacetylase [Nitriliruptorales bacterium]|nr:acetylornithine deacetylase [Nitriliruptorales bacterium]